MSRFAAPAVIVAFALAAAACGGSSEPEPEAVVPEETAAAPASDAPRVFFMQPQDGDTVTSPVQFVFASDMFEISPVPQGDITESRPAVGHYHLGVDTDCLPPGTEIPMANPWIHFGTGTDNIEMELEPGPHRFVVQAGDDLHVTIPGLCETINITVEE